MLRRIASVLLLLLLVVPVLAHATDVQATLDRSTVQLGETVTLNLRISGDGGNVAMPDLAALNADFDILGRSQNSSLSIVNGRRRAALTIGVVLRPKHVGVLTIPALEVAGTQTAPLQLTVDPPNPAAAAAQHRNVFMQAQVTPAQGWVGQQFSYVVQLYFVSDLSGGSLDTPQIDGVQVNQIGGDLHYDAVRDGRTYHVIERRYALTPQHAGQIEIPALRFQGEAIDPNDPNSFFGAGTPVSASAPAQTVQVQVAPASWGKAAWLPARALSLDISGWPDANTPVRVGQPINLTMKLQATGLPFETLPQLSLPPITGATMYPDKPVNTTGNDGAWLLGSRQQAFAVVPTQPGTLSMPATSVTWWNVQTGQPETATIPARSVSVLPAIGAAATSPLAPAVVATSASSGGTTTTPAPIVATTNRHAIPWRWIALASLLLWLLSVLAWLWWRRRRTAVPSARASVVTDASARSSRQLQQAFLAAARGSDATAQLRALLAWARAERPAIQHPGELAAALADAAQRAAIADLQHRRYAAAPASASSGELAEVFKRGFAWRTSNEGGDTTTLPPLYPFKLK